MSPTLAGSLATEPLTIPFFFESLLGVGVDRAATASAGRAASPGGGDNSASRPPDPRSNCGAVSMKEP